MKFGMFFMGEYVAMFTSSALIVTLYFGGFQIPWFSTETLVKYAIPVAILIMVALPVFAKFFTLWISKNNKSQYERVDDPRVREAQVYIKGIWGLVIALEIVLFIYLITVSGGTADRVLVTILQIITFLVKTTFMCFVYVWVRWTLPRFRYDQLQKLGWQTLLPLSLLNIFVTSAIVVALS
jgi:NADH-quinone oxidoreductase subunit H